MVSCNATALHAIATSVTGEVGRLSLFALLLLVGSRCKEASVICKILCTDKPRLVSETLDR